jgi:hypothetical protein
MNLTIFLFTLRSPEGQEYSIDIPAKSKSEAEHVLNIVLSSFRDKKRSCWNLLHS